MKYIYTCVGMIIFLSGCTNTNIQKDNIINNNMDKKIQNNNVGTDIFNNPIVEQNLDLYIKLKKEAQVSKKEEVKIKNKINKFNNELKNDYHIDNFSIMSFIDYKDRFSYEIKELEKINLLKNEIKDIDSSKNIDKKLDLKKKIIFNKLSNDGLSEKSIISLDKISLLDNVKREELYKKVEDISKNIILESGQIVSKDFKNKYESTKERLLQKSNNLQQEGEFVNNGPIPYEIIIESIIKEDLIKEGKCDLLNNEIDRAYCEGNN